MILYSLRQANPGETYWERVWVWAENIVDAREIVREYFWGASQAEKVGFHSWTTPDLVVIVRAEYSLEAPRGIIMLERDGLVELHLKAEP